MDNIPSTMLYNTVKYDNRRARRWSLADIPSPFENINKFKYIPKLYHGPEKLSKK
jgi:hypothetical protein